MLRVEREAKFNFLSGEYQDLFARSDATAFQHPIWMDGLVTHLLAPSDYGAATLVGRGPGGQLQLVLPMVDRRRLRRFEFLEAADLGVSDYNMPVIDPRLLTSLSQRRGKQALTDIFSTSPAWFRRVRPEAVAPLKLLGFSACSAMGYSSHELALDAPFDAWRRTLEPVFLRFLDRKRRRLEKRGLQLTQMRETADIHMAFDLMRRFRKARLPDDLLIQQPFFDFYRDVAVRGLASGLTRTFVLFVGGVPRAALFGVSHKGRFAFLLLGFDFEGMRNASLGLVLIDMVIEDCMARGDRVFDLTIGDQAYKRHFCPTPQPMYGMWAGPRVLTALAHVAYSQMNRIRYGPRVLRAVTAGA